MLNPGREWSLPGISSIYPKVLAKYTLGLSGILNLFFNFPTSSEFKTLNIA